MIMACNVTSTWGYGHFDPLWNAGASSVERDALRERERQARALRAGLGSGDSAGHPIFRAPVKVDPGQEDETSRRIKNTLGDFSQVQRLLTHDPNHLIGISRTNAAALARLPHNPVNGSSTASTWNGNATDPGGTRGGGGGSSSGSSASKQQQQQHHGSSSGSSNHPPSSQSSSSQSSSHHGGSSHRSHHGSSGSHHSSHHHSSHHHHKKQPHQQPGPPLMNGQYKSSSSVASSKAGGRHPSQMPPQGSSGHHHHQSASRTSSSHEQGRLEDAVPNPKAAAVPPPSSSVSNPPPSCSVPSSQGPPNGLVVRPPAMRAPSKDVNNGTTPAPTTQHQSSTSSSSSLTVRTESNGPASGNKPPSSSAASRSSANESKPKRPVPWLQISAPPSSDSGTASAHPELESILKEMKKIPPVLTAIETPRKEERRPSFPMSPVPDQVPNHLEESGDSKHLLDPRKAASPPGSSLQDDLEMSDSDDDQEPPFGKSSSSLGFSISKNTPPPNESVTQLPSLVEKMSSSESSSSDSDDSSSASGSGSDSESSDSEGSAPEASRETQSWKLADFIDKRGSPATGLGGLATMAGRQSRAEDSLVDEDSFTPILSQYPNNRDADLAHMLKSPSPEGLALMRSPARMAPMFSLSPVHSSSSRSPVHPASQARPAPRSPSPPERPPAIPTGTAAALSDDEGPCQMQNGRITMRLGKQQPPPPKSDPEPPVKPQPEPVKRSWPSKASKKETSPSLVPNSRNKAVPSLVPPVAKPEPVENSVAAARAPTPEGVPAVINRAPSKRSHSDRYNEKRSKIHKPRPVLSDSSSDDEAPPAPAPPPSAGGRLPLLEDSRVVDQRTIAAPSVPSRGRPPKGSRSDSKVHKGREGLVVPKREGLGMPRTPPEPPSLLSPIGQRCGSEVRESAPTAAAAALAAASAAASASDSLVVCVALSRLLRLPGRLGKPQPSPSRSRERQPDAEPPSLAQKPDVAKPSLASGTAPASLAKGKSSSKRKSGPSEDRSSSREHEKKRRVSTGSSGSLRVKREPSEAPRPDEESESRYAWPAAEPLRSCDSPSSLSSYSSQRSSSRQHRGRPSSSSGKNRSEKGSSSSSRRDATPSSDKSSRRHHHHHRDKKESAARSSSGNAADDRHSDSATMVGSADPISSSQVHSWEGLLSSSDQSEVHGHETPGSRMGPLATGPSGSSHGMMGGGLLAAARKEEPLDKRGNPSQLLLSFNSHREWESK